MEEKGVATLDRALAILAAFSPSEPRLSLAELSRRTGLYKSTLLRLITSLEASGYLVHDATDGDYQIGPASLRLANIYQRSLNGGKLISASLQQMVAATEENANFYVRRGDVRVCIYCVDSPHAMRHHTLVGDIFPLDKGAAGRLLSAFSDDRADLPGMADIRASYFAVSHGEYAAYLSAVATPVFGFNNRCEGALATTGLTDRFTPERIQEIVVLMLETSARLTDALGGNTEGLLRALHLARTHASTK